MIAWLVLLTVSLQSSISLSAEPIESQLAKCDLALNAKIQEASLCSLGITYRNDEMARLQKQNAELLSKGSAWYNNPFLWATLGVFVGVYAGARATR